MKILDLKKVTIILVTMLLFLSMQISAFASDNCTVVKIPVRQIFDSEVEGIYYAKIQFTVAPDYGTFALRVNDKVITPEINLTNEEVSLLLVNLGQVNLKKGENELQIESAALASGHDTGFFGIDKLTLRK